MPRTRLRLARAIIWVWVLIIGSACVQEGRTVVHKRPIKGMGGYKVITREAQGVEKRVYEAEDIRVQEVGTYESLPSAKPQQALVELAPVPDEPAPQNLRRARIPLRRNRNLLLKQQSELNDQD